MLYLGLGTEGQEPVPIQPIPTGLKQNAHYSLYLTLHVTESFIIHSFIYLLSVYYFLKAR